MTTKHWFLDGVALCRWIHGGGESRVGGKVGEV